MTVFHFGGKPESHEQFFQRLADAGQAEPDPAWEYSEVWSRLAELQKLSQELREYLSHLEDRTPETDAEVYRKLELLRFVIEQAAKNVALPGYVKKEDPSDF